MSITYYRELAASEFLDQIEQWHRECAWHQNFGKDRQFIGAPAPKEIARLTYGKMIKSQERLQVSDEVTTSVSRRLLPCIIDARPISTDIVLSAIRRASARQSMNRWDWEGLLGIACALYRKQNPHEKYSMNYEETRDTRDYLYGCLLAVADHIEERSLWLEVKDLEKSKRKIRDTNAAKLMQRFSQNPYDTWRAIRLQLNPYISRLKSNRPGLYTRLMARLDALHDRLGSNFTDTSPLSGEFLLGFHSLRKRLWDEAKSQNDKDISELDEALQDESNT